MKKARLGSQAFAYAGIGTHTGKTELRSLRPPPPHLRRYSKNITSSIERGLLVCGRFRERNFSKRTMSSSERNWQSSSPRCEHSPNSIDRTCIVERRLFSLICFQFCQYWGCSSIARWIGLLTYHMYGTASKANGKSSTQAKMNGIQWYHFGLYFFCI